MKLLTKFHLHYTPTVSNTISGIAIVGAILAILDTGDASKYIGLAALICATVNIVGFLVTDRMLKMFKSKRMEAIQITNILYLISAVAFILGIKRLSHPKLLEAETYYLH